jgi:hypothetical protein
MAVSMFQRPYSVQWKVAGMAFLFIFAIAGIVLHTIMMIYGQKSDAVMIDLAGR